MVKRKATPKKKEKKTSRVLSSRKTGSRSTHAKTAKRRSTSSTPQKAIRSKALPALGKEQKASAVSVVTTEKIIRKEPTKEARHIAVAGNIGSGKTTLTEQLARHFGWEAHFEDVENNPYLYDFYNDMVRWSFNLQVYFLNTRFRQILNFQRGYRTVIQDRTIYEDAYIFAPNLHAMGLMSTRDFENYLSLFETLKQLIAPPDLLIYLRASIPTLVDQIQKRGREYEENLRLDYLKRLNEYYESWINKYDDGKLLIIDIDHCNFAENKEHLGEVINRVHAELYGLF